MRSYSPSCAREMITGEECWEISMAKKSGPAIQVKRDVVTESISWSFPILISVAFTLAGCSASWHHASRSASEMAADERACAREAEEITLIRTGTPRTEYGTSPSQTGTGMSRGETPMERYERANTTTAYNREFESCMRSKGYSKN